MKNTRVAKKTNQSITIITLIVFFLLPLIFSPFTANLFDLNKNLLLALATALALIFWMVRSIATKSFRITITPFTAPLLLFAIANLISSFSGLTQFTQGFISTTANTTFLALFFVTVTTAYLSNKSVDLLFKAVTASGLALAISAILETIDLGPTKWITTIIQPIQASDAFITPAGSAVVLISFLIPVLIVSLLLAVDKKKAIEKGFFFISSAVITAALVISIFTILPGKPNAPVFLPFDISWQIAVENIKSPKSFLIGVGPQNYLSAFTINKPVTFNQTEFWNTRFSTARNHFLHIFTTTGIVGFGLWVFLLIALLHTARRYKELTNVAKISLIGIGTILLINMVVPSNTVTLSLFVFLTMILGIDMKNNKLDGTSELILKLFAAKLVSSKSFEDKNKDQAQLLPIVIGIPVIIFSIFILWGSYRVYAADYLFRQSLLSAAQNNGTDTYNNQRQAITQNPFLDNYRRSYANTNLSIATTLSQQENLSDQDRNNISILIQQAIREGRNAIIINPNNPANWETLATIYRNLINVAEGATQWTTTSYAQAISLDPNNPRLRVDLGGIYFQLQDFSTAIRFFEQATQLKPDFANAHYNLAVALAQDGQIARAIRQYDAVLALVDSGSADFNKALEEQNLLKQQVGEQATDPNTITPNTQLNPPQPLPSPNPNSQIQLDDSAAPPSSDEINQGQQNTGFGDLNPPAGPSTPSAAPQP